MADRVRHRIFEMKLLPAAGVYGVADRVLTKWNRGPCVGLRNEVEIFAVIKGTTQFQVDLEEVYGLA